MCESLRAAPLGWFAGFPIHVEKIKIVYVKVKVRRSGFILWLASRADKKNQINSVLRLAIQS